MQPTKVCRYLHIQDKAAGFSEASAADGQIVLACISSFIKSAAILLKLDASELSSTTLWFLKGEVCSFAFFQCQAQACLPMQTIRMQQTNRGSHMMSQQESHKSSGLSVLMEVIFRSMQYLHRKAPQLAHYSCGRTLCTTCEQLFQVCEYCSVWDWFALDSRKPCYTPHGWGRHISMWTFSWR